MDFDYKNFLIRVADKIAPSGNEREVIDLWDTDISHYVSNIYHTSLGNSVAVKYGANTNNKKILITAHADEIGLIITYIDNEGFLYFEEIGGVDMDLLLGRVVSIQGLNGVVNGVIGVKPIHCFQEGDRKKNYSSKDLWIDIHVKDKEEAFSLVHIGCVATLKAEFLVSGARYIGKAMDNRCSMAVLISVAKYLYDKDINYDLYFVATVQEELRARGAQTVANSINPDMCLVIDVTHATDYPSMSLIRDGDIKLGNGVVVALGPNMDSLISKKLISIASERGLKYQLEVFSRSTGTDANTIQIAGSGIPTGLVSIPCRYMHSPVEIVDEEDLKMTTRLLAEFILALKE